MSDGPRRAPPQRDRALLITPTLPLETGNGLAMRAGMLLRTLSQLYDLDLLVAPVAGGETATTPFVAHHTRRVGRLPLQADTHASLIERVVDRSSWQAAAIGYGRPWNSRFCTPAAVAWIRQWSDGETYAAVLVMRLYLSPLAEAFRMQKVGERPLLLLDLDDDDQLAHARLADLALEADDQVAYRWHQDQAEKNRSFARLQCPLFAAAFVCSEPDRERLRQSDPRSTFMVLPNTVPMASLVRTPSRDPIMRLLFVGSFVHPPNADGLLWFTQSVLPKLVEITRGQVAVDVVGAGAPPSPSADVVTIAGFQARLEPFYARADVAIAPLRAGAGTRIKVLEAMAAGTPVVSTGIGCEGLDLIDGEHLLIADDADAFAAACWTLKADPALAAACVARSQALVTSRYTDVANVERIRAAIGTLDPSRRADAGDR